MTIGKIGRVCVWILLLGVLLGSCQKEETPEIPLELLRENIPSEESKEKQQYYIVVPNDASASLWETAQVLSEKMAQQIQVEIPCVYEHESSSAPKEAFFLLVGWLRSVDASDRLMKHLKKDDYLCRSVETGICLGGKSDEATRMAVERFCEEILPASTASLLMHPDGGFSYVGEEYAMDAIHLNGFDLHTYGLVYPNNASSELLTLAYAVREEIAEISGYWLDVCSEKKIGSQEKRICIGTDTPPQEGQSAYLIPIEQGLLLTGWDFFGISVAARSFCSMLLREGEAKICVDVTEIQVISYSQTEHKLVSIASEAVVPFSSSDEVRALTDRIQLDEPDAVFCGRMPSDQSQYLTGSMSTYEFVTGTSPFADLTVYTTNRETVSLLSAETEADALWTVSSFWVGNRLNGFQVVQVSGTLTEHIAWSISELNLDWNEPILIFIHTRMEGGSFSMSMLETHDVTSVWSEQYTTDSEHAYFFACYATSDVLRVQMGASSSGGYRMMSVDRLSAF